MNIAQQAYQDGQEYRKANGILSADEALAKRVMEAFTHTGLDFQHWQLYHDNWMSGYQSVEDEQKEQASANTVDTTSYTLVPSSNSGRYALDDPEHGRNVMRGDSLALLLNGQWIEGSIEHAANLYAIESAPRPIYSGFYFIDNDGNICGLCAGMKVRLG
jgi:uncharacterized protein DUF5348